LLIHSFENAFPRTFEPLREKAELEIYQTNPTRAGQ